MTDKESNRGCSPQIIAAVITAIGGITVALITISVGQKDPAPAPNVIENALAPAPLAADDLGRPTKMGSAVDTSGPAPGAPARIERSVVVRNDCSESVSVQLAHENDGSWDYNGLATWEIPAGVENYLAMDDIRIKATSSEMYLHANSANGTYEWKGEYVARQGDLAYNMMKPVVEIDPNGDFKITLTCNPA